MRCLLKFSNSVQPSEASKIVSSINNNLPTTVAIRQTSNRLFNLSHQLQGSTSVKTYIYCIRCGPFQAASVCLQSGFSLSPHEFSFWEKRALDWPSMETGARYAKLRMNTPPALISASPRSLIGRHDFRHLCCGVRQAHKRKHRDRAATNGGTEDINYNRTILDVQVTSIPLSHFAALCEQSFANLHEAYATQMDSDTETLQEPKPATVSSDCSACCGSFDISSCVRTAVTTLHEKVTALDAALIKLKQSSAHVIVISVTAEGFLRKMMRQIASALREVGSGLRPPTYIEDVMRFDAQGVCIILMTHACLSSGVQAPPKPSIPSGLWLFQQRHLQQDATK